MASSNGSEPELSRKDADFEKREAEDCRSLKDIKELLERKAKALDGVPIPDGGGACIGIYFSIANDLPPVIPKSDKPSGKWIPTSETMPDNPSENVLVCDIDGDIYKAYLSDYDGWRRSEDFEKVKNVIAWQPLPPAYKMESEDHK